MKTKKITKKDELLLIFNRINCARSLVDKANDNAAMGTPWGTKDILSIPCSIHGERIYYPDKLIKKQLSINSLLIGVYEND